MAVKQANKRSPRVKACLLPAPSATLANRTTKVSAGSVTIDADIVVSGFTMPQVMVQMVVAPSLSYPGAVLTGGPPPTHIQYTVPLASTLRGNYVVIVLVVQDGNSSTPNAAGDSWSLPVP